MARKGNRQKNGLDPYSSNSKKGVSDPAHTMPHTEGNTVETEDKIQELPNGNCPSTKDGSEKKSKKKLRKSNRKETKTVDPAQVPISDHNAEELKPDMSTVENSNGIEGNEMPGENHESLNDPSSSGAEERGANMEFPETVIFKYMKTVAISVSKSSAEWLERNKPVLINLKTNVLNAGDYVVKKLGYAKPVALRWIVTLKNILLLLLVIWLDCALRGIDSLLRMGTTSFFSIVWCAVLSIVAMVGIFKFLIALAIAAIIGLFAGFVLAILLTAISGTIFLWFYGSFWITGSIAVVAGLAYALRHDRIALFIATVYATYCAWTFVGFLGVVLGLNLSFISSEALLYFLRNTINEPRRPPQEHEAPAGDSASAEAGADRSSGVPSTSGSDAEMTSEDEVVRLLNCADHYSALGLSRFQDVDVSVVKREYRKKAMLVHPDKNMGNEKAAEAFKKLQNAYEVLLDTVKRKEYDDELKREELLGYFRKFQEVSQENNQHGFFSSTFADGEEPPGESRRVACKKCGHFHVWVHTKKLKSRARWCQECKDFHQARDGDGWVEQSSHPLLFGILQKVEPPRAYICADSKIYDATDWYICQGMRCAVNTHKPSFHVNTSAITKNGLGKGSGQKGPPPMEETMSEEEFFEWLQNAVQSGMFENAPTDGTSFRSGNGSKTGGSSGGTKRKKKGKKQW